MAYNYSIIVPYRDIYNLLCVAIDSIPDREDVEIIIVDNSDIPLLEGQIPVKKNASVVYLTSSPTRGAGCARNIGLQHANGSFLLFLDADDYYTDHAFEVFDNYIDKDYDIVFFKTSSIHLSNSTPSSRHKWTCSLIDYYLQTKDESPLRYRWYGPIAKMIRNRFVKEGGYQFEEIKVANDAWFSVMVGHYANKITVNESVVYVITEGEIGSSLTKQRNKENYFIRYKNDIKINSFLKTVGRYKMRNRLLGSIRIALVNYGFSEAIRYVRYAMKHKCGIF